MAREALLLTDPRKSDLCSALKTVVALRSQTSIDHIPLLVKYVGTYPHPIVIDHMTV
jgi:hypothetical protein